MSDSKITTVFLMWDIRYPEASEEKFRIEQDFMWQGLQEFVKDNETTSITFYAKGLSERVGNRSYESRIYEEALTKEEFLQVNQGWIEARKRTIGIV